MKLNNKGYAITIIVFGILIVFIVVLSSLLVTMNNTVKLNKTVKEEVIENIQLSSDATGLTITERISKLESEMSGMLDKIYPIGSIYISTVDEDIDAVKNRFPDTKWEKYGQGRTLVGEGTGTDQNGNRSTFLVNSTGGEYTHKLTVSELAKHTHIQNAHYHIIGFNNGIERIGFQSGSVGSDTTSMYLNASSYTKGARSYNMIANTVTAINQNTGGDAYHNNIQPYITVYMYKRIK